MQDLVNKYTEESKKIIERNATDEVQCRQELVQQRFSVDGCSLFDNNSSAASSLQTKIMEVVHYASHLPNLSLSVDFIIDLYYDLLYCPKMKLCENGSYVMDAFDLSEFEERKESFKEVLNSSNSNINADKKSSDVMSYLNFVYVQSLASIKEISYAYGKNGLVGDLFLRVELNEAIDQINMAGYVFEQSDALAFAKDLFGRKDLVVLDMFEKSYGGFERNGNLLIKTMIDKKDAVAVEWLLKRGLPSKLEISKLIPGIPLSTRFYENKEMYFFDYAMLASGKNKLSKPTLDLLLNAKEHSMLGETVKTINQAPSENQKKTRSVAL